MRRASTLLVSGMIAVGMVAALAGCSQPDSSTVTGTPAAGTGSSASTSTTSAAPSAASSLSPDVQGAVSRFDAANQRLATANSSASDAQIVAALVGAGFDKSAMQITPDTTTIGRRVDSIEVSVLVDKTCLIGEFQGSTYTSTTAPVLGTGKCLVGNTATIN